MDEITWELTGETFQIKDRGYTVYLANLTCSTTRTELSKLYGRPMPGMEGFTIRGIESYCIESQCYSSIGIAVKKEQ